MGKLKHIPIDYKFSSGFRKSGSVFDVLALKHTHKKKSKRPKILYVLDHVPREDLQNKKLMSGVTGKALTMLDEIATDHFAANRSLFDQNFMVLNYQCIKTYGKPQDYVEAADAQFAERLRKVICEYKPDTVAVCGKDPLFALQYQRIQDVKGNYQHFLGTTMPTTVDYDGDSHSFNLVPNLSLSGVIGESGAGLGTSAYMAGYFARNHMTAIEGEMRYKIPELYTISKGKNGERIRTAKYKTHLVSTISGVKKCLKKMAAAPIVAIDTETTDLYRITNKVLTVQFACNTKEAYIIPVHHKDSPFTPREKKKIAKLLRDYFEIDNNNQYQVYANAKFDLNVMRSNFGIRCYKANLWDVFAAEFVMDENLKGLQTMVGKNYYSLGNIAMQYGCTAFYDAAFGKDNRSVIKDVDLDEDLQEYCALDVIVPMHLIELQRQRGRDIGYKYFEHMVGYQISDQIHTFSVLESTGAYADLDYLFSLKMPDSPISMALKEAKEKLYGTAAIDEANEVLGKLNRVPKQGLYGNVKNEQFDIKKTEHKQILFFDVLGLKPLEFGKKMRSNGKQEGKIGKSFQKEYGDVPVVKAFDQLTKVNKLHDAYVKSLIKLWQQDRDFKVDRRIRPNYNYLKVVTGRTSANNPNLQQIPSRSELAKHIKRLFISRQGRILIKVDYSAHEVRCWGMISGDEGVARSFDVGTAFRNRFKILPDAYIGKRISYEGDVHKVNASYFFGIDITEVTKPIRDSIKGVIFGLIYQQSLKNLAKQIGRELSVVENIVSEFLKRYPEGYKWFDRVKNFAKKNLFVESPIGRRRHVWGLGLPKELEEYEQMEARSLRQSVNSPVQGFGSDFMMQGIRNVDQMKFDHYLKTGDYPDMDLCVSVHDSLTVEVTWEYFWLALKFIDEGLTSKVTENIKERYGTQLNSQPEVDYEIGFSESAVKEWNFDYLQLRDIISKSITEQNEELGYTNDPEKIMKKVFSKQYDYMPDWMKKQLHSIDQEDHTEKLGKDIRTKEEIKLVEQWRSEIPDNAKKLEEILRKELSEKAQKAAESKAKEKGLKLDGDITGLLKKLTKKALKKLRPESGKEFPEKEVVQVCVDEVLSGAKPRKILNKSQRKKLAKKEK